ncbi:hypothetical protein [Achromobacter xylosoxidans]
MPLYLDGEHWGAVRIGLDYVRFQAALEAGAAPRGAVAAAG